MQNMTEIDIDIIEEIESFLYDKVASAYSVREFATRIYRSMIADENYNAELAVENWIEETKLEHPEFLILMNC